MTPEQIRKVLAEIHQKVPESLKKSVVSYVKATPTIEMVMEKAMEMESLPEEKRRNIKELYDAGEFSKMRVMENPKVAKQIDQMVSREINKAIKEGRLPGKKKLAEIMKADEQNRNQKSSEGENPSQ